MAKSDQVEKKVIEVDGETLEGLINIDQYELAEETVNVPGPNRTVPVKNGVTLIPPVLATFKITRDSRTLSVLQDWKNNNEQRNCVVVVTDGSGSEIRRELWPNTECSRLAGPAYDASAPVVSSLAVTFLPEDIIDIEAEG